MKINKASLLLRNKSFSMKMNKFSSTKISHSVLLVLLLFSAFIVRLVPIDFPSFTTEEARTAFRAYTLSKTGKDELNRPYPLLFNSLEDYKLPATSYITAAGLTIFGKSDLGARILFVLIGTTLVFLVYQIAKSFNDKSSFWLISGFVAASAPPLIFLSKTPNEIIVLIFLFALLFYLLINKKNLILIICTFVLATVTSKLAWFILLPFVLFTVLSFQKTNKKILIAVSALITIFAVGFFLSIPQAKRSLLENNFSLFSDITIKNGIDKLRGQGIEFGWNPFIERFLFNKVHFILTGFLHWISHFNPAIYFGRFDEKGILSFSFVGVFLKILIIPAILGIIFIIKKGDSKLRLLPFYFLILTYPAILIYPALSLELVALTIPIFSILIASGFMQLGRKFTATVLMIVGLELIITIYNFSSEQISTVAWRPTWIKPFSSEVFSNSQKYPTAVSDDLVEDIVPFIQWYAPLNQGDNFSDVSWPYKFRQYNLRNIKIIGSEDRFRTCGKDEKNIIYVSERDLKKIQAELKLEISKTYIDFKGENKAYLLSNSVCID